MTYYLGNSSRSVITIRVRYSKKLVEDFPIQPGEELVLEDRQFQLIEGDKTQCDVLSRLNVRHVIDELADTNVEIQALIDSAISSMSRGVPVTLTPDQPNQKGISTDISSADHVHSIPTDEPVPIIPDATTQLGANSSFARSDHQHRIDADTAVTIDGNTTNTEGVALAFARADHTHNITTGVPAAIQPDFVNDQGTSAALARANHIHRISTAAPANNLSGDTTNQRGNALTFSRSDHEHNIETGAPITQVPDQTNAEGTSPSLARADHVHNIATDVVVNIGVSNVEGTSNSFARADHVHDHGQQTQDDLHALVTQSTNGFMSSSDKTKIDGRKAGIVASGSFSGNPRTASVSFSSSFPDTNYTIVITGVDSRAWTYLNKTVSGFVISTNSGSVLSGEVSWQAIRVGE